MAKSRDVPDLQALLDEHLQRIALRRTVSVPEPSEAPLRRVSGQLYADPEATLPPPAPATELPVAEPEPVSLPGRYAAATAAASWGSRLGGALGFRSQRAWSPASMAALCLGLALAGLGLATWAVLTRPQALTPTPMAGAPVPSPSVIAEAETDTIIVDVAGKVRRPGIAVLPSGSRVVDALEAAGGALPKADTSSLNLARVLTDGEQILVGIAPPSGVSTVPSGTATVSLNSATAVELETLPQVGPVTAAAIIAWRTEHGAFRSVDELLEVDGIGEGTLAQIRPHVTL